LWTAPVQVGSGGNVSTPFLGAGYVENVGQVTVLYVLDQHSIYAIPLNTTVTNAVTNPPTVSTVYTSDTELSLQPPVYFSKTQYMVVGTSQGLSGLQVNLTGTAPWTKQWDCNLGGFVTPPSLAMGKVFVGTPAMTMAVVDVATGTSIQSNNLGANIENLIAVDQNNAAYVPTDSGQLFVLDGTDPTSTLWSVNPGNSTAALTTPVQIADGMAYVGCNDGKLYAYEIQSQGASALTAIAGSSILYLVYATDGNAYFGTSGAMWGMQFVDVEHDFMADSQMMVDFVSSSTAPVQVPTYVAQITLYDSAGNVRSNESVKLWTTESTTLLWGVQALQVGPDQPVWLQTNGTGQLAIYFQVNSNVQPATATGLSTPPLMLWGAFMGPEERILFYPDQRLHQSLSNISGSDLQNAVIYNQADPTSPTEKLLPANFQQASGLSNANSLALAINNTIGLQQSTGLAIGVSEANTKYLAFPASLVGVSSWASLPPTTRPASSGAVANWNLSFADGTVTWMAQDSAKAALQRLSANLATRGITRDPGGILATSQISSRMSSMELKRLLKYCGPMSRMP
jgi:hypothetical protein